MELLKNLSKALPLSLVFCSFGLLADVEGLVLRDGLDAEVVYDGSSGVHPIGLPAQIAIDPQTGELYFGNVLTDADDHILIVNPSTGEARKFPFFGNGVAFNKDGSKLFFGLSNLMLGVWNRDANEYRKFTILPGVEAVQVLDNGTAQGRLLVANSDYGKNILGVDSVWEVDQGDGYYEPILKFNEGSEATGVNFAALDAMAVDGEGNIYTLTGQGKMLIKKADGSYVEGNSAPVVKSGLMQGGLGSSPDGVVYMQDTGSGEIFAYLPGGRQVMVAYGAPIEAASAVDGGISSDGSSIYFVNDKGKVIRIYAKDGGSIKSKLEMDLGITTLNGTIRDSNGGGLAGVMVQTRDKSIESVTTDNNGQFSISAPAGLYHLMATVANAGDFHTQINGANGASSSLDFTMESYIPEYLAPGLVADVIATKSSDSIDGSSDVSFDIEGNLYSLNHSNGTITKTVLDPETRAVMNTFIAAKDGGIANSWSVAIGQDLSMYSSSSNSGLLRLPPADPENVIQLTVDPENERIVRDQSGVDRMVSFVTDIDGVALMSNGDIMMTSGSGGSIIDGFPDGTFNTLIRYSPATGSQSLFSRGIPAGSSTSVFNNPDVLKVDNQDNLYVANRGGNAVQVNSSGVATLIWPGDAEGTDYPEGLSSYTAFSPDNLGGMFFKGVDTNGSSTLRMLDPSNDRNLLVVASGMYSASGFGGFEFDQGATSVVLSEWDFVLRISTLDGRSIAENLVSPPSGAQPTIRVKSEFSFADGAQARQLTTSFIPTEVQFVADPSWSKLPELWMFAKDQNLDTVPAASSDSSSGGAPLVIIIMLLGAVGIRRRFH